VAEASPPAPHVVHPDKLFADVAEVNAVASEYLRRYARGVAKKGQQHMLTADVLLAEFARLNACLGDQVLVSGTPSALGAAIASNPRWRQLRRNKPASSSNCSSGSDDPCLRLSMGE
jgi:hypothetical protein